MKLAADKHRQDVHFEIDDWVFVKLHSYQQGSLLCNATTNWAIGISDRTGSLLKLVLWRIN
ncbi:hypothetical protein HanRHA438_Chr03g0104621 [Helianthus annuus]|nr:hypothetical protein HanRHA438_Chr03g0104621 [Helianthus annuus]